MKKYFIIILLIFCSLFAVHFALASYTLEVGLPGVDRTTPVGLVQYINYLYLFGLSLVGIAALGSLVIGGFKYMLSDTITTKEEAKKNISGAIYGLILALAAYLILNTINPDLVNWSIDLPAVETPAATPATEVISTGEASVDIPSTLPSTPSTPSLPDTTPPEDMPF